MLALGKQRSTTCEGISRRSLLHVGSLALFGISLPRCLAAQQQSEAPSARMTNCILLWMGGGPSNIDTFDMKPDAPAEYRGEFRPIASNLSGVQVCEHMPKMSQQMHRVCLVKSVAHSESGDHTAATHYLLTGYPQRPDPAGQPVGSLIYPAYGSVVGRQLGWRHGLPPYMILGPEVTPYAFAGYMGSQYDPLLIKEDPNEPTFAIQDVSIPAAVGSERTARRRTLLQQLDGWQQQVDRSASALFERNRFYQQAYDLITSPAAKEAFQLDREPDSVRNRYGRNRYGQSCLLARRLIEAGVRFVTVATNQWDTHQNNFSGLREPIRLPQLDQYWSALLDDLDERGLLETTLVIWMGEFGRTPKVNGQAGRDHWAWTNTICLSGGGVNMGSVVGQTDARCERTVGLTHTTHDFAATVYRLLGIDATKEYLTPDGRPILINYHGTPIREVMA